MQDLWNGTKAEILESKSGLVSSCEHKSGDVGGLYVEEFLLCLLIPPPPSFPYFPLIFVFFPALFSLFLPALFFLFSELPEANLGKKALVSLRLKLIYFMLLLITVDVKAYLFI